MKRFLHSLIAILTLLCLSKNSSAQSCLISDAVFQNVRINEGGIADRKCTATFDASFTIANNPNNKYIFIQTYIESATQDGHNVPGPNPSPYPNTFQCKDGVAGKKVPPRGNKEVGTPLLNIAIDNSGAAPSFTNYVLDPSMATKGNVAASTIQKTVLSNGNVRYELTGIQMELPYDCMTLTEYVFISNFFTTASADATTVNCVNCGLQTPLPNITITGITNCDLVTANITNLSDKTQQLDYALYVDADANGELLPTTLGGADILVTSGKVTVPRGQTRTATATLTNSLAGQDVFVAINFDGMIVSQLLPTIACALPGPLPVSLKSFNAKRVNNNATLSWETASENNNKGFSVQRNSGNGWVDVSFVESKATGGNSSSLLTYEYSEANNQKGVTQYRLKQVDIDGKFKLSEIRSINGVNHAGKVMVYPNPSSDGSVNIIFDSERGNRDVLISDMGGRIIKQYRNVSASNLRVDQLSPGMYSLRITNQENGAQQIEKLVVNK
ncbi:T9SS type A sorting domain-containing protein [Flavisolibacter tropicus]|uniref:Secretion system C-terminal sorting domain-containing protein n=1 Tax=Flavisolibacter tropicus TaxID=1492898 RepID=A0A172U157_9BACT|nr:T9SS type A sorting domain-containing protein [Flavisolibacter tropicus]ANE52854.1 hypothetical protein SY85_22615 [Flavisolibacter tropicus]